MKQSILNGWNLMRIVRLALGLLVMVQGFQANEWLLVALGALFSLMPLFNIGCCGASGCNTPVSRRSSKKIEDTTYEEVR
ncbi:hypothetical protein HMPREF0765_0064 [Sphingobacterium spiritivorum ATCC 33300]|uniref:DUF2892 domain-containing protein n=3 Tax=Sphingobacteriaceae TaxID=84566 RepID=C2FRV8_SPHSI|nr:MULTISPECIES: hypothetical protein [Sphingobacteriaceae]EEI94323.1 hypothetical protein HMPREF0765_0064 [Sphingobacterium spiritivorum ATCC 33300]QQS98080.1 hypothetical protein I6J03_10410 [Sphingobacterium spiritivorum]